MAVAAIIFALLGFSVDCASYSEYLSARDREDFASIFKDLGVQDKITYGTFQKLCEALLNQNMVIRDASVDLVRSKGVGLVARRKRTVIDPRRKLLLVDEVDVFLSKEFFGKPYAVQGQVQDPSVNQLIALIWSQRASSALSYNSIKSSTQFVQCCKVLPEFFVTTAVLEMLQHLHKFEDTPYVVDADRIGYVQQDSIAFNRVEGYKTLWCYYKECDKGNVTPKARDEFAALLLRCGLFSYAEIPKSYASIWSDRYIERTESISTQDCAGALQNHDVYIHAISVWEESTCFRGKQSS